MANTKVTSHVIANNAITASMIQSAAVTDAKLHSTLDLSGKTLTLPATAIPSASTATTQAASDNSTKIATTAYVTTAIGNLIDSAPTALNTLNELAAALGDDASFSSTVTTQLATKLPLAGGTLTGALTLSGAPTNTLHATTKTYVDTADALKLNLSGGTLTGDLTINTTGALQIPAGTTGQRPSAATAQIRWNTTDGALEVYNGSAWTAVGTGSSNKVLDTFTGDGSTTTFTLSVTPANEDAIMVFIDGAYQEKSDYVLTNNSLVLDTAPLNNEKIAVHITTASVHDGTSAVNQQFTGDGSTTDFTLSQDPKSENNTHVYINGVYQQKTDYTVTGTTLTFDTAPTNGDIIEVNMFTVATLGNTDTVTEGVSNQYFTNARARGAISVSGNAISYNSSTGVLTANFEEGPTFTSNVIVNNTLGVGTSDLKSWAAFDGRIRAGARGIYATTSASTQMGYNWYYDGAYKYIAADTANRYYQNGGNHIWESAASGSADGAITWSEKMRITASGKLGVGTDNPAHSLHVLGSSSDQTAVAKIQRVQASGSNNTYTFEVDSSAHNSNVTSAGAMSVKYYNGTAFVIDGAGKVGINVEKNSAAKPQKTFHVEHAAGASEGILISGASDTVGHTAGILLRAEGGEADSALRAKGGIFFERTGTYGVGKLHLANDTSSDNNSATISDAKLTIGSNGYVSIPGRVAVGHANPYAQFSVYRSGSDPYTPTSFLDQPTMELKGDNVSGGYVGTRITNTAGNYEWFAGVTQDGSNTADYVIQGYNRSAGATYQEMARLHDAGVWNVPKQPHWMGSITNTGGSGLANSATAQYSRNTINYITQSGYIRFVAPIGGVYLITFTAISDMGTGRIDSSIYVNGSTVSSQLSSNNGTGYRQRTAAMTINLAKNDQITVSHNDWYSATGTGYEIWRTFSMTMIA